MKDYLYDEIERPDTAEANYYHHMSETLIQPLTFLEMQVVDLFDDLDSLFGMGSGGNYFC
jgi:hypothetical protein